MKSRKDKLKIFKMLFSQLINYGLNPDDWRLQSRPGDWMAVDLRHRLDDDLRLTGFIEMESSNKAYWKSLHLHSI